MADNSFLMFNSFINISDIKVDKKLLSYEEAISKKNKMYSTTVLFNNFRRSIDAKYFDSDGKQANATFVIYRKNPHQKYYKYICTLKDGDYTCLDFNITNNEFYHYLAAVETQTSTGTEYIIYENKDENNNIKFLKTKWDMWSICNIEETMEDGIYFEKGNVWSFGANIENEDLTQNMSVTFWDTLGQYSKASKGKKNYMSGTFTSLLGNMTEYKQTKEDGTVDKEIYQYTEKNNLNKYYGREIEKLEEWKKFCNDGELKLLKDIKGNAWIIQMNETPTQNIDIKSNLQETMVSFTWQEVLNIDSISIISTLIEA